MHVVLKYVTCILISIEKPLIPIHFPGFVMKDSWLICLVIIFNGNFFVPHNQKSKYQTFSS